MARKILDKLSAMHVEREEISKTAAPQRHSSPASVGGLKDSLDRMSNNAIRDLDVSVIDQDGLLDRLMIDDESISELSESIRKHGQQVPILVRPASAPGRYRIIYGRRRLAAIRRFGGTVKAIIRHLDDKDAVIAQGQENNLRQDPSFIEKALFIGEMRKANFEPAIIREAMGLSRQAISTYNVVLEAVPIELIEAIGPAPDVGRRPWTELADILNKDSVDVSSLLANASEDIQASTSSNQRFEIIRKIAANARRDADSRNAQTSVHHGGQADLTLEGGQAVGVVQVNKKSVKLSLSFEREPAFVQWFSENADSLIRDLHNRWRIEAEGKG